jgi:ribonuclease BN (tRNA processing enzyme)
MRVQFLGCGDAFGSGGRFNTCFHVTAAGTAFLIDCGASSMIAMRKFGVDPNGIASIFVTHLHGDHFAGIPFFILDAQLVSRRQAPLTIAGPPGLPERLRITMEALFPGSSAIAQKFPLSVVELAPEERREIGRVTVTPYPVRHACGAPPYALRLESGGKVVAYTGDTEWTETLIPAAREADLFIAEAYFHDKKVRHHLDWRSLEPHLATIRPKRLILTHFSPDMLSRVGSLPVEAAEDGKVVEIA